MTGASGFEINERGDRENLHVAVVGELDLATIPELRDLLEERLVTPPEALVLDLSDVSFMDSSGLRALIELDQRSRAEGWGLSLIAPSHEAANIVLRMSGAAEALPFIETPGS